MSPDPEVPGSRPAWLAGETRRIGRYRLGPTLGRGGMGEVFEAWDTLLGRRVALKLLTSWDASAAARLMREAQIQARVEHPNICRVLDVDVTGDQPYIAMQLVHGPTLKDASLRLREAVEAIQKVAEAVHAAHRLDLVHRDLKPTNILLERGERGGWIPYVCDFGLAKDLHAESLTVSHATLGTPAFMAPEQMFLMRAKVGPATDLYGLGATLYDVLTGEPPIRQMVDRPRPGRPPFTLPRDLNPSIPEPLEWIILRCLEWNPGDRYPSAAALAEDLRRFLDGESLQPRARGLGAHLRWGFRRHPWAFAGAGAALSAALGLTGTLAWSRQEAARQARVVGVATETIKDLQYQMRIERMLPPHDLRPAFQQVRLRMEALRTALPELGSTASGPSHFALGWGHLLLREPEAALGELEAAWRSGYRTPDVACTWAKAHCEAYLDSLPLARQAGAAALEDLRQRHLVPARQLLQGLGETRWVSRTLVEAQVELLDRHSDRARVLAREASRQNPSDYEARMVEAAALYEEGFAHQLRGRYPEAEACYLQADGQASTAAGMGRSDEMALKIQLNRWLAWVALRAEAGGALPRDFQRIEALADDLLALNPEWLPAIADKLTVIWRRGEDELVMGRNPEPGLQRGIAILEASRRLPEASRRLQRDRTNLYRILAESRLGRGLDPEPAIRAGLDGSTDDEYVADLLVLRARWAIRHGRDPGPDLDRALAALDHPTFRNAEEYGLAKARARVWYQKARWIELRGGDPAAALARTRDHLVAGLTANPVSSELLVVSAQTFQFAFRRSCKAGKPDPALLHQAVADAQKALRLRPGLPAAMQVLAAAQVDPDTGRRNG